MSLSLCNCTCMSCSVYKYIYFAPNVPKVWGLHRQPFLSISVKQHILNLCHIRGSFTSSLEGSFVAWAPTLRVRVKMIRLFGQFDIFHSEAFTQTATKTCPVIRRSTGPFVRSQLITSTPTSLVAGRGHTHIRISTLCKAPVCMSPFHPNDCIKKTSTNSKF